MSYSLATESAVDREVGSGGIAVARQSPPSQCSLVRVSQSLENADYCSD